MACEETVPSCLRDDVHAGVEVLWGGKATAGPAPARRTVDAGLDTVTGVP